MEFDREESVYTNLGFLELSGEETLFPVDGQHRVAGIKSALEDNPEMCREQVPVIFIAHSTTAEGRKKTRKLFSTLNRRAKPVGQNENIALDEDDICAIITRELIQKHPLCATTNIVNSLGKQIPTTNETAFTSLITLYQCVEILIKSVLAHEGIKGHAFNEYKLYRPADEKISELEEYVFACFDSFITQTAVISAYVRDEQPNKAKQLRNSNGGNILFRPIVLTEYFEAATILVNRAHATDFTEAFRKLANVTFDLAKQPWINLIWDGSKIVSKAPKTIIRLVLLYMADKTSLLEKEKEKVQQEYAKILNISVEDAVDILEETSI